ncbi:FtsW/RodA/SpoVE family cell cycle protein [Sphingomonas jaspsi]|uniref:FtsW/RodA/SpoVE family cell cycle protein n=1 Tax=Sphingomonas jaspsi TaxID=392409 RepID=UPI0004B8D3AF|nr:FtsW/RodA/SpoVE family cell cycle protein [Sphingomonas jaspsi]
MGISGAAPLALGTAAVACGAAFLWNVGALPGMASRNVVAYLAGLLLGWLAHKVAHRGHGAAILFGLCCILLAAVLAIGTELDGVTRWLPLGPFMVQPALVLCPLILAIVASREGRHWRAFVLLPLLLIALQPDAATSFALAVGVAVLMIGASRNSRRGWSRRRIIVAVGAMTLAVAGLLVAGIKTPPPVAFVEGTVGIAALSGLPAMALHAGAIGLAVWALASRGSPADLALAAYLAVVAIAAVFWAFPMPIAGAGPSHLIGFGIAIGWLAEGVRRARRQRAFG